MKMNILKNQKTRKRNIADGKESTRGDVTMRTAPEDDRTVNAGGNPSDGVGRKGLGTADFPEHSGNLLNS